VVISAPLHRDSELLIWFEELLRLLRPDNLAVYDQSHTAHACLKGTRVQLLDKVTAWMTDSSAENVFWLRGPGGTGKTTVCHSVAKIANKLDFISATVFPSDILNDKGQFSPQRIIPTIAFQLTATNARLHYEICDAISLDPDICSRSAAMQAEQLLLNVLRHFFSHLPPCMVLIFDAIDEYPDDSDEYEALQQILLCAVQYPRSIKMFFASKKLPQRMGALSDAAKATIRHCDIKRFPVHQDIWLYLRVGLKELQTHQQK
jgi:hypothetical protein